VTTWIEQYSGGWWACPLDDGTVIHVGQERPTRGPWRWTHRRWVGTYVQIARRRGFATAQDAIASAEDYLESIGQGGER
jgi:hypothetical protein